MRLACCVVLVLGLVGKAEGQNVWDKMKAAAKAADQQKKAQQALAAQTTAAAKPNGYTVQGPVGTPELTTQIAGQAGFFDVTGIRLGMPAKDAVQVLKAHSAVFKVTPQTYSHQLIPGQTLLSGVETDMPLVATQVYEKYAVAFTMAPNAAYVVGVGRTVHYPRGKQPTVAVAVAGMREKYGQESFVPRANPDSPSFMWVKDLNGNAVTGVEAQRAAEACTSPFLGQQLAEGAAKVVTLGYAVSSAPFGPLECGKYATVAVYMSGESVAGQRDYLLNNLTVVAVNGGLYKSATQVTHEQYLTAQKSVDKNTMDKANGQKVTY